MPETQPWDLDRVERDLPDLAPLARLHRAIEDALRAHERDAGSLHPEVAGTPGVHWLEGRALLAAADARALAPRLAAAFAAVARAAADASAEARGPVEEILASGAFGAGAWSEALGRFADPAWRPAAPHAPLARFLALRTISMPARHLARAYTAPLPERWRRATCPWCGVAAAASVARTGAGRTLLCVLCGGRWETAETLCTGCGERDLTKFRVLANRDAGPATIESCGRCGTSVKVFGGADLVWGPPLALEIASVRLDLLAERDEGTFRDSVALAALYPPG